MREKENLFVNKNFLKKSPDKLHVTLWNDLRVMTLGNVDYLNSKGKIANYEVNCQI